MIKFEHKKITATKYALNINGDVQEHALSLLNIINHAREYPLYFIKVENTPSNLVYVTATEKDPDAVREFLEDFGEIEEEEKINILKIQVLNDCAGWQYLTDNDQREIDFIADLD